MIKTSDRGTRPQLQTKKEQARQHLNKLDIFTLVGPGGRDPRLLRLD